MSFTTGTIEGTYYAPDGVTPDRGYVHLIPNSAWIIDQAGNKILSGRLKVKLGRPAVDGDTAAWIEGGWYHNGHFSQDVPATDDTTLVPDTNRQWTVVAKLEYQHLDAIEGIEVPTDATVDMADVTPAAAVKATLSPWFTQEQYEALLEQLDAQPHVMVVPAGTPGYADQPDGTLWVEYTP